MKKIFASFLVLSLLAGSSSFAAFDPLRDPSVPDTIMQQKSPAVTMDVSSPTQSSRRLSYGFRSRAASVYSDKTQTDDITNSFTSEQGFSFTLPKSFEVVSDDLTSEAGAYVLSDSNTTIQVESSDQTCPMTIGRMRLCLEEILKDLHQKKVATYKNLKRQDKREFSLDQEEASKQTINIAVWSLSQARDMKIGVMVFIEKNSKKVWTISVEGMSTDDFFKQPRYLLILAQSLSQKDKANNFGSYNTNLTQKSSTPSASRRGIRTRSSQRVSMKSNVALGLVKPYTSEDGSISLELPSSFIIATDTLGEEEGMLEFKKDDQYIKIMPLDKTCPIKKEGAMYRACIESIAEMMKTDLEEELPELKILKEENIGLNLDNTRYADDLARITKWFDRSRRYAQIIFVHPTKNQVWLARIKSNDQKKEILTDPQLLEKVLNSLHLK